VAPTEHLQKWLVKHLLLASGLCKDQ